MDSLGKPQSQFTVQPKIFITTKDYGNPYYFYSLLYNFYPKHSSSGRQHHIFQRNLIREYERVKNHENCVRLNPNSYPITKSNKISVTVLTALS